MASVRSWRPSLALTFVIALGACVGFAASVRVGTSEATPACTTLPFHGNVVFKEDNGTHRGERVANPGMTIFNGSVECIRLSTIDVYSDDRNQIEIGWFEDPHQLLQCSNFPAGGTSPHLFTVPTKFGTQYCPSNPTTLTNTTMDVAIRDDNLDGIWSFLHNGSGTGWTGPTLTFSVGQILTNGERWGTQDAAIADFNGLQYRTQNLTWASWTNAVAWCDSDPDYNNVKDSNTHVEVNGGVTLTYCFL